MLSLSSREISHDYCDRNNTNTTKIVFPSYVPNIALTCVMLTGIIAMLIFICKKAELTDENNGCKLTTRHDLHRKYSFYSMAAFFICVCTLNMNYLLVEFSCRDSWFACKSINMEYFLANVFLTIFHFVGMIFAMFEFIICWMMKRKNFIPSQWVWHLVAVVQAANITMWFHSLLKESYDRIDEHHHFLDGYFSFCYTPLTPLKNNSGHFLCYESLSVARWFLMSAPILLPITIEYNVLVTETLLDRSIGAQSHKFIENADEVDSDHENEVALSEDANEPNERTPLLGLNGHLHVNRETSSIGSKMFTSISILINTVQLVLCILVYVGCRKWDLQSQNFNDIYTVYTFVYYLFLIICSVVGMICSVGFKRQKHSHVSFLEYLLLFATVGVLFQSVKRIVAFIANHNKSFIQLQFLTVYYLTDLMDLIQVTSQIVFYYYVKDVKLQFINGEYVNSYRTTIFKNIIFVISTCNFVKWVIDSFLYPDMTACITPTKDYVIEPWPVFDNIMIPIYIFFRYNSAMLFWCIYTDLSCHSQRHQGGVGPIEQQQITTHPRRYVCNASPVSSHRPSWPSNRLRGRSGHHLRWRTRNRPRVE